MLVAFVQKCFVGDKIGIFVLSSITRHNLLAHDDVADALVFKWADIGLVVKRQMVDHDLSWVLSRDGLVYTLCGYIGLREALGAARQRVILVVWLVMHTHSRHVLVARILMNLVVRLACARYASGWDVMLLVHLRFGRFESLHSLFLPQALYIDLVEHIDCTSDLLGLSFMLHLARSHIIAWLCTLPLLDWLQCDVLALFHANLEYILLLVQAT